MMYFMHNLIAHELAERQSYENRLRKVQLQLADHDDEALYAELAYLKQKIDVTDEWLALLSPDQHFIIRQRLICGKPWSSIEREYRQRFSEPLEVSIDDLFLHHEAGIEKIVRFLISEGVSSTRIDGDGQ